MKQGPEVILYEPTWDSCTTFFGSRIVNDSANSKSQSGVIIANRYDACLDDVQQKAFSNAIDYGCIRAQMHSAATLPPSQPTSIYR